RSGDKEGKARLALLEKCQARLAAGEPVRGLTDDEAEVKILKSFGMLTAKPVLYVANVDENDLHGQGDLVGQVRQRAEKEGGLVVPVCAKLEAELAELDESD